MNTPFDPDQHPLLSAIINNVNIGLVVLDRKARVVVWNKFMHSYSGIAPDAIIGEELFPFFPEIPKQWLLQKLHNVFILKNYSFTIWEQRPYLFKFRHTRPVTTRLEHMRQNCTFIPLKDHRGRTDYVCIAISDVTHTSVYQETLLQSIHNLEESNHRDALTHAFNRRYMEDILVRETSRSRRHHDPLSFIMVDLDHFKRVNDQYGHLAGDEVLVACAKQLQSALRASDILTRYGGEEFGIILPNTDLDGGQQLAERLRQALEALEIPYDDQRLRITASLGVSQFNPDRMRSHELIDQADQALYQAKQQGRNRVVCHTINLEVESVALQQVQLPLRHLKLVHSAITVEPAITVEKVVNQLGSAGLSEQLEPPESFQLPPLLAEPPPSPAAQVHDMVQSFFRTPDKPELEASATHYSPEETNLQTENPHVQETSGEESQALVTYVTIGYK